MRTKDSDSHFQLIQMALGYWRSQVLFTANELDIFTFIGDTARTAPEVAQFCKGSCDYTERLLNACVSIGLLEKKGDQFQNSNMVATFLIRGRPNYMGHWISIMADWYRPWGHLTESVQTGKPVVDNLEQVENSSEYTRHFILAMHDYAMITGQAMANRLDLTGRYKLLDVGGGAGSYSILLAQKNPQLHAIVLDLPQVTEVTRQVVARQGLDDRIRVLPGNFLEVDFGSGYDVILFSNVLHQENPRTCVQLLRKAHDALAEDGMLIIQASFLNATQDGPAWPALQSLMLMLVSPNGRTYSVDETMNMVTEAGFINPELKRISLLSAESLLTARKKSR